MTIREGPTTLRAFFCLIVLLFSLFPSRAWVPVSYYDPELVKRSELIVSAHVLPGSIKFLPYKGANWGDYSLKLSIDEFYKGQPPAKEITVLVHYGLTPVVGGHLHEGDQTIDSRNP